MIDLKRELERELGLNEPPDLWNRIEDTAANAGPATLVELPPPRRRVSPVWLAVAAVAVLVGVLGTSLRSDHEETVGTTPATESHPQPNSDSIEDVSSTVTVQITSCRGGFGIVTAAFEVTKHSTATFRNDPSDYIVRIEVNDGTRTIGEASVIVRDVYPGRPVPAEAFAPIADTSRVGPTVTNCLVDDVQRVPGT